MSTYVERSMLRLPQRESRPAERRRVRPALLVAGELLWRRMAGGGVGRLPDPARHPECWFRFL